MQRKFLEDLGLEKEIVDKIMSENGSDIEKTKARLKVDNHMEWIGRMNSIKSRVTNVVNAELIFC